MIIGGDWNCVVRHKDVDPRGRVFSGVLGDLLRDVNVVDVGGEVDEVMHTFIKRVYAARLGCINHTPGRD